MTEGQESERRTAPIRLDERAIRTRVGRAVTRARLALVWESLWPLVLPILIVGALYLIVSWFGIWTLVPNWARIGGLVLFGLAGVAAILLPLRLRIPPRSAALSRVERITGLPHRPATAANDRLASAPSDPMAVALWNAHRFRLLAGLGRLRAGWPSPGVSKYDPYALRFLVLMLLVVAFVYSGPSRNGRLTDSLAGPVETVPELIARIDAWATPPTYTGRPPVFLTGQAGRPSGSALSVPEGTVVTVRIASANGLSVVTATAAGEAAVLPVGAPTGPQAEGVAPVPVTTTADRPSEFRMPLSEATTVTVRGGSEDLFWQFAVEQDQPPEIALNSAPTVNQSGALTLAYSVRDDYGVVGAQANFSAAEVFGNGDEDARPLVEAPSFGLSLPQMRATEGSAETIQDLLSHPWAGGKVTVQLVARDEAGQEGFSEPFELTLPARGFSSPLARALVEQRRVLAFDANQTPTTAEALDALTLAPDRFIPQTDAYLGMRAAYHRTVHAHDDDVLRSVLDLLWDIALGLEDAGLSEAQQNLRQAAEELRQALENGASDEEIERLTEQLRQAMQQYMQAMAEEAARQQQQGQQQQAEGQQQQGQEVSPQDLNQMLDQIQQLAELGARDAAREMLNQLQQMLENMQMGQQGQQGQQQQGDNPMAQALQQLGELIQQQQRLMDQTYQLQQEQLRQQQEGQQPGQQQGQQQQGQQQGQQPGQQQGQQPGQQPGQQGQQPGQQPGGQQPGQGQPGQGQPGQQAQGQMQPGQQRGGQNQPGANGQFGNMSPQELQQALQDLQQQQGQLQQQLQELMNQMQGQGMQPGDQLGQADQFMGDANRQLGQGEPSQAVEPQNDALQALRDSARNLAQQLAEMMQQQQNRPGQRQGQQVQGQPPEDPLGRPQQNSGMDPGSRVEVPDEIDMQRAREILDTIRRRLGESFRDLPELQYLERLLEE